MPKTKIIQLPCFGIRLTIWGSGGTITTNLKEPCSCCGSPYCFLDCPASKQGKTTESADDARSRLEFNRIIDGIEALVLSAACEGIDVEAPSFLAAIETAVESAANKFD